VESLVHLSAQVRLVAAYRLEIGRVKKHPLSALLEDLRLDFLGRTFEAYDLVARLGMDDLKELLLGPDDATVHGPRFGRYPGLAGEPLHEALQLPHRELHVVEKSIVGYAGQGIQQLLGPDGSKFAFVRTDPEFVGASIDEQVTAKRVGE
jgi:hypothetical protein